MWENYKITKSGYLYKTSAYIITSDDPKEERAVRLDPTHTMWNFYVQIEWSERICMVRSFKRWFIKTFIFFSKFLDNERNAVSVIKNNTDKSSHFCIRPTK